MEVIIVICWGIFFGVGASRIYPDNSVFELAGAVAGLSLGLLIAWGIRFLTLKLGERK